MRSNREADRALVRAWVAKLDRYGVEDRAEAPIREEARTPHWPDGSPMTPAQSLEYLEFPVAEAVRTHHLRKGTHGRRAGVFPRTIDLGPEFRREAELRSHLTDRPLADPEFGTARRRISKAACRAEHSELRTESETLWAPV